MSNTITVSGSFKESIRTGSTDGLRGNSSYKCLNTSSNSFTISFTCTGSPCSTVTSSITSSTGTTGIATTNIGGSGGSTIDTCNTTLLITTSSNSNTVGRTIGRSKGSTNNTCSTIRFCGGLLLFQTKKKTERLRNGRLKR